MSDIRRYTMVEEIKTKKHYMIMSKENKKVIIPDGFRKICNSFLGAYVAELEVKDNVILQ